MDSEKYRAFLAQSMIHLEFFAVCTSYSTPQDGGFSMNTHGVLVHGVSIAFRRCCSYRAWVFIVETNVRSELGVVRDPMDRSLGLFARQLVGSQTLI